MKKTEKEVWKFINSLRTLSRQQQLNILQKAITENYGELNIDTHRIIRQRIENLKKQASKIQPDQ